MYTWNQIEGFHGKCSIQQDEDASRQQAGLRSKEKTNKMLYLEHSFIWSWQLDTSESRSETPAKFLNVVLVNDGEDQLNLFCEKLSIT